MEQILVPNQIFRELSSNSMVNTASEERQIKRTSTYYTSGTSCLFIPYTLHINMVTIVILRVIFF